MSFSETTAPRATSEDFARYITAVFDSREHAELARRDLLEAGIQDSDITIAGADTSTEASAPTLEAGDPAREPQGFWETLKELFMPDEDRYTFEEGLRRGSITVAVRTDTTSYDRVLEILDRDGAVDLDARELAWRSEGWSGYTGRDPLEGGEVSYVPPSDGTAGFGASTADRLPLGPESAPPVESPGALGEGALTGDPGVPSPAAIPGLPPIPAAPPVPPATSGAAATPLGRRDDTHGRTRVRAYVPDERAGDPSI